MAINKTINKRTNTHGAMRNCIEYVLRQDKTSELLWIFSRFTIFNYFTTKPVRIAVFLNDFLRAQLTVDLCYSLVGNFHRSFNVRYMLPEIVIIQQVIFGKIVEGMGCLF